MKYLLIVRRVVFITTSLLKEFFFNPVVSTGLLFDSSFVRLGVDAHLPTS